MTPKKVTHTPGPERLYDVVIVRIEDITVVSVIGKDMNEHAMEKRIETGISKINTDRYFVAEVPAGQGIVGARFAKAESDPNGGAK